MAEVLKKSIDPTLEQKYPSNSNKSKEEKKIKKVVQGKVVKQKPSTMKVIASSIFGEEIDNVGQYVLHDVLIPAAKEMVSDMVQSGIEMLLFGEKRSRGTKRDGNRSYVSYNSFSGSRGRDRDRDRDDRRPAYSGRRNKSDYEEIVLERRAEAEEVLSNLSDLVIDYGQATVADLYDLVGITGGSFTDTKWGWTTLRDAEVKRMRNGYLVDLPKPRLLD